MAKKRRLSALEFDTICPLLNINEDSIRMAHSVLVEGKTLRSVAAVEGCTHQFVDKNTQIVLKMFDRYQKARQIAKIQEAPIPPGWARVSVIAPTDVIEELKKELAKHEQACIWPDA